ncbi:hypothetical protein DEO72_LG2g4298 [Vigna unguiculata]|uniref:GRF-type domain-containing protein n=1 Tax=Vigna unguiculata TaxID=3917 RepID=A0A4D6L618_VIGUN|nr:hypothetical protein DEO72_LG2g4298 [Vigna unguiculata]
MSRVQSSSSCSHNSRVMRNQSSCCSSGGCRGLGEAPTCNCGVAAVLRTIRTIKNGGRQFWGCPNFKGGSEGCYGCNFFKWCIEDDDDKKVPPYHLAHHHPSYLYQLHPPYHSQLHPGYYHHPPSHLCMPHYYHHHVPYHLHPPYHS